MSIPEKTIPAVGAWAFWQYDLYPHMLGGEIVEPSGVREGQPWYRGDRVFIKGLGGYYRPLFCVSAEDGPAVKAELDRLRKGRAADEKAVREKWDREYAASPLGRLRPRK